MYQQRQEHARGPFDGLWQHPEQHPKAVMVFRLRDGHQAEDPKENGD
jgi:hypothetical protein